MSSSSYAAWAKFDVEAELERVDEIERRADQHKHQLKQVQAKESVESSATQAAQQSADILAAQAAVAALKAKKRVHKGRQDENAEKVAEATEKAAKLQAQAALFAQKHELLQHIMENRRLGDKALANEEGEAKHLFEKALAAVRKLEKLAPELLKAEDEKIKSVKKELESSNQQDKPHDGECSHESEHGASCGKGCSHGEKKVQTKTTEALPKANDLVAIIKMFYKDVYMGIGTCELEGNSLAAASDAFKEVLLRDDVNLTAWLKRGQTFERMNAPLLALLHYNRITTLDPDNEMGKESLERVKIKLLTEGDALSDSSTIKSVVSELTGGQTCRTVLERIRWTFEEANVLATESFFVYSTTKYQVVLGCLEVLRAQPEFKNEDAVSPVLREIEISCHVNIASGCLEMQRNHTSGLTHCEQAVHLDGNRAMPHFRMGQLYHALHKYDNALRCFEIAKSLVPRSVASQSEGQQKKMLITIAKEVDKCEFDRNQYDTGYLRSLAAKQD